MSEPSSGRPNSISAASSEGFTHAKGGGALTIRTRGPRTSTPPSFSFRPKPHLFAAEGFESLRGSTRVAPQLWTSSLIGTLGFSLGVSGFRVLL